MSQGLKPCAAVDAAVGAYTFFHIRMEYRLAASYSESSYRTVKSSRQLSMSTEREL